MLRWRLSHIEEHHRPSNATTDGDGRHSRYGLKWKRHPQADVGDISSLMKALPLWAAGV